MQQSAYTGIKNMYGQVPYLGGICRFWYALVNEVATWPTIDPATQYLTAEPALMAGATWRGPVPVPDAHLGLTETQENTAAGPSYKQQVKGNSYGDVPVHRVNFDNMAYGQYVLVGKLRAGGFFVLLGSADSPFNFDNDYTSGNGSTADNAKTQFAFTSESMQRALVMPSFLGQQSGFIVPPPGGGGGGGTPGTNEYELLYFTNVANYQFSWTSGRIAKFGIFPEIELYVTGPDGVYYKSPSQPWIDAAPGAGFTTMYFDFGGPATGFILIK